MDQASNANVPGSLEEINRLFSEHYSGSLRTAYRILRSPADAEDAVQTAYCAAFQNLRSFRGDSTFKTWITRIVVNACLAHLRKHAARQEVAIEQTPPALMLRGTPTPETLCYRRELGLAHRRAVSELHASLRRPYALRVMSDLAPEAIAGQLGMTEAAAKARIFRARTSVKRILQTQLMGRAA